MIKSIFCFLLLAISLEGFAKEGQNEEALTALTQVPVWLNTSRALKAEDLKGRIVLIDFWTYCCINCMHIFPDLKALEREFGTDLTVVGVHSAKFDNEKDRENIRSAILRNELEHPVVDDADFKIWKHFGVNSWPTLVLIDPNGNVDLALSGEGHLNEVRGYIRALVDKYQGQLPQTPLPLELEKLKAPDSTLHFPSKLVYVPEFDGAPALFISDSNHNRVVGVRPSSGQIFLSVGDKHSAGFSDGSFSDSRFNHPQGLAYRNGLIYVADLENHALRLIDLKEKHVSTLAGQGKPGSLRAPENAPALSTSLSSPWDLAFLDDNTLAIAMAGTHQIWTYDVAHKTLNVLAGSGVENIEDGPAKESALAQTSGLSKQGERLYFVDAETSSLRYLEKDQVHTLIGSGLFNFGFKDGLANEARLQHPLGLYATDGKTIYIADSYNHSIRSYDLATRKLSTLAGDGKRGRTDGAFAKARFNEPNSILLENNHLLVADTNNHAIRVLDLKTRRVSTLDVKDSPTSNKRQISETLPNLIHAPDVSLAANREIAVKLSLPNDWKINEAAPSFVALFQMTSKGPELVSQWEKAKLKTKSVRLPALKSETQYRLQGTFYYCKEKENSLCLIESHDQTLKAEASNTTATLPITLTIR